MVSPNCENTGLCVALRILCSTTPLRVNISPHKTPIRTLIKAGRMKIGKMELAAATLKKMLMRVSATMKTKSPTWLSLVVSHQIDPGNTQKFGEVEAYSDLTSRAKRLTTRPTGMSFHHDIGAFRTPRRSPLCNRLAAFHAPLL
jgi:hypothetical protein